MLGESREHDSIIFQHSSGRWPIHFIFFFLGVLLVVCGVSVPWPETESGPWQWKLRILTIRLPRNSANHFISIVHWPVCLLYEVFSYFSSQPQGLTQFSVNNQGRHDRGGTRRGGQMQPTYQIPRVSPSVVFGKMKLRRKLLILSLSFLVKR